MTQRLRLAIGLTIVFLPGAGYAQQRMETPSGRMVDIGGHKMYIECQGPIRSPVTVVFESGGGGTAKDWSLVRPLLRNVRTCAYDRAGSGLSEPGPLPRTMRQEVFELHELLKVANANGPYVLVGQSLGGLLARLYTQYYGKDVVGVVLVDPTNESSMLGSMRYGGWARIREKATGYPIPEPRLKLKDSVAYDANVDFLAEEFQLMYLSRQANPRMLADRPLIVLAAGKRTKPPGTPDELWKQILEEKEEQVRALVQLSGNSKFHEDPASGHAMQNDNPELVARSIEEVIRAVLKKSRLFCDTPFTGYIVKKKYLYY
jgi:pimeloyl-ACP methyl ester carboxylesterase